MKPAKIAVICIAAVSAIGLALVVRAMGSSGEPTAVAVAAVETRPMAKVLVAAKDLDFVQFNYSIMTPDAEERLLPLAADHGIPNDGHGAHRGESVLAHGRSNSWLWSSFYESNFLELPSCHPRQHHRWHGVYWDALLQHPSHHHGERAPHRA